MAYVSDSKRQRPRFYIGDLVFLIKNGTKEGPYLINSIRSNNEYLLSREDGTIVENDRETESHKLRGFEINVPVIEEEDGTGTLEDLELPIQSQQEALDLTADDHLEQARQLQNLAVGYRDRYLRSGAPENLESAIQGFQEALDLTPDNHPDRVELLHNLASAHRNLYLRTERHEYIELSVRLFQETLNLTADNYPDRARLLHNFASAYKNRYQQSGAFDDLEISIQLFQKALNLTVDDHPDRAHRMHSLGLAYRNRHERSGALDDLEISIQLFEKALNPTEDSKAHPTQNLIDELNSRHMQTGPLIPIELSTQQTTHGSEFISSSSPKLTSKTSSYFATNELQRVADTDTISIYSSDSNTPEDVQIQRIEALLQPLIQEILSSTSSQESLADMLTILPELLKSFACQLGYNNPTKIYLDIMVFVRKYRQKITDGVSTQVRGLEKGSVELTAQEVQRPNFAVPEMSVDEKIQHWDFSNPEPPLCEDKAVETVNVSISDESSKFESQPYTKIILASPEFEWLLNRIHREAKYHVVGLDCIGNIRRQIIELRSEFGNVVSRRRPTSLKVIFSFEWIDFLLQQSIRKLKERGFEDHEIVSFHTLEQALVLIGSSTNALATTCGDYLKDIWSDRGIQVIELVKEVILCPQNTTVGRSLGNIELVACYDGEQIRIQCEGETYMIAEVAEILGWLMSALCAFADEEGACLYSPVASPLDEPSKPRTTIYSAVEQVPAYRLTLQRRKAPVLQEGQCWHGMFENVVITEGYPIPRRIDAICGLELSLPIISILLRTSYTTTRNAHLSIREFSHALLPTERCKNFIRWHYIFEPNGVDLPYWKMPSSKSINIKTYELPQFRHIIGWCSRARSIAGAAGNHYDIDRSRLSPPSWVFNLETFNLTGSQFVGGIIAVRLGIRSPALHIASKSFPKKIKKLQKSYVVLWDDQEKRGWLIDGLSTLLHLLRLSLRASELDELNTAFKLKPGQIEEPSRDYPQAAIDFFYKGDRIHPNMKIELYDAGRENYFTMQDQVEHLYDVLNDAVDQQRTMSCKDGIKLTPSLREHIEGWDFVSLATDEEFYYPCATTLNWRGTTWIELIHSINAVVLFGRGFGEMIKPTETETLCEHWSTLPTGKYYLAAYESTVTSIVEKYGNPGANPIKLTENLVWHSPSTIYGPCKCKEGPRKHSDFTQVLLPVKYQHLLKNPKKAVCEDNSAIIFGHNSLWPWYWPNKERPTKTNPVQAETSEVIGGSESMSSHSSQAHADLIGGSQSTGPTSSNTTTAFTPSVLRFQELVEMCKLKKKPKPPSARGS